MLIDTHQHVFWQSRDDAGLIADLDQHRIDHAWLLSWEIAPEEDDPQYHRVLNPEHRRADGTHAGIPLTDLIKARNRYPDRFVLGYCPHPLRGDAPSLFEAAYHMHGVRVCGEWKFRMLFDDPRCLELFRKAGQLNCPVVLHLDVPYRRDPDTDQNTYCPAWYGGTIDNLRRALQACPETIFIGHAPGFWREISADADHNPNAYPTTPITGPGRLFELFDQNPNLYADLSANAGLGALRRDREHARRFLERFQDRLLFARDIYGQNLYRFLIELDLPQAVQDRIFHANAQSLVPGPNPAR